MEEFFVLAPMIGGILIAVLAIIMDSKQKKKQALEQQSVTRIISTDDMPLEEMVRAILQIQVKQQERDKWVERIIGFMMGLASSLIVSVGLYYLGLS